MQPISIILADAQYLIRVGLRHLMERIDDFEIVGEAKNMVDLKHLLKGNSIDVVILDHLQTNNFGDDVFQTIRTLSPKTQILIISADDNKQNIYKVIESGVNSFLTKQCDEEEIINAVKATAKGEKFFCSKVLNFILEKSFGKAENCAPSPLTPRECEIVRLVSAGKIAKEIAGELNLSTHTVYTHRKNIMKKLQLNSTSELVMYAISTGLVETI
ncbi:MAG: DNA-binding NarL/FixJ family response regulator [Saprospiraceae bacterium]|jgi:DNA-binding NarL/FixJ family response regulator